MPLSGNFNRRPFEERYQEIEIDSMCLAVVSARLIEKVNRGFKFSFGEPMMKRMADAGALIKHACRRWCSPSRRVGLLAQAQELLEATAFIMDCALCAGAVTAEEKAKYDVLYDKVAGQLAAFLTSQSSKIKSFRAGQGGAGNAAPEVPR